MWISCYSGVQISWQRVFWAGNQGNHQHFDTSLLTYICWLIFMAMKQNLFCFFKFKMADSKKGHCPAPPILNIFFKEISWIGPWVGRIDWCEGHWCGSTVMALRLSDISSKTGKKCIFHVFRLFLSLCLTASRLYRLSQINALQINHSNMAK